jgi:hypothetical protein
MHHLHPLHRLALALLMFFAFTGIAVAAAAAWIFGMAAWMAISALMLSALMVAGAVKMHEAWRVARWNAGHRLR